MKRHSSLIVILIAVAVLAGLSLLEWEALTGGRIKNFNLIGDLIVGDSAMVSTPADDNIDEELKKYIAMADTAIAVEDTLKVEEPAIVDIPKDFVAPKVDGVVLIEDYSRGTCAIKALRDTLLRAGKRPVRIAMLGDSYIEGDIFAQDVRAGLQKRYGGRGVGYMPAFSAFPGFRRSVRQSASGWEEHEINKMKNDPLRTIIASYHKSTDGAYSRYRKSDSPDSLDHWNRTVVVCQSDSGSWVVFTGPEFESVRHRILPSKELQSFVLEAPVSDVRVAVNGHGVNVLGVWLEGATGIVLDDISLRGNSGVSHRVLNKRTTEQLRRTIDYDLIIVEFGLNALSASQTNYKNYGDAMVEVVENLKDLYPNAQIMVLGVGDRAHKVDGEIVSMRTVDALVRAQRDVANKTGSMFWDTREAMGGNGAARKWHEDKLINSDYIHLNHRGGKRLADIFLKSLDKSFELNEGNEDSY